jgi:thiol:disulfide interchange protein DsbA
MKRITRREFVAAVGAAGLAAGAHAQQGGTGEGHEFRSVKPPAPSDAPAGKVEVLEFFWYGCPHCYDLQPALKAWMKKKSPDIELRRVPAVFRESWIPHTRLFYTLEAMGQLDRLHDEVFKAIHEQKTDLGDLARMQAWVAT